MILIVFDRKPACIRVKSLLYSDEKSLVCLFMTSKRGDPLLEQIGENT